MGTVSADFIFVIVQKARYTDEVCKKSRKVPHMMQDEDAEPPNCWMTTLTAVATAQALSAFGITLVCPFLPLYVQTLDGAQFIKPELPADMTFAASFWGCPADRPAIPAQIQTQKSGAVIRPCQLPSKCQTVLQGC